MTDLTEQWKKGKLPSGRYYTIVNGGSYEDFINIDYYNEYSGEFEKHPMITKEVLAPVPSYEELQNINKSVNNLMAANIKLQEENTKLKELLEECRKILDYAKDFAYHQPCCKCIAKIDQALGEDK